MKQRSLYRITVIVSMFVKFILQLYLFKKRNKNWDSVTNEKWTDLLKKQAIEYRDKSISLGGLMIKVGQFLSTRGDIFPEAFINELDDLSDQVPPVPTEISMEILEEEWRRKKEDHLKMISSDPIASASIGEVYKGTLNNGTDVAVKIQRHNIDKIIHTDFKALKIVLWLSERFTSFGEKVNLKALHKEMVTTIGNELDYRKELKNGLEFRERFQDTESIYIPDFYEKLSTKRVLVMEWVEGAKVTNTEFLDKHRLNRKEIAEELYDFIFRHLLHHGTFHADPHQGNILVDENGRIIIIDFGMIGEIKRDDALHLRQMIQGFVLKDYPLVIGQLEKLGFLLPNTDKKKLQDTFKTLSEAYLEDSSGVSDEEKIEHVLGDVQEIIRKEPIQLPAQYAFLIRASSIATGVLTIVDPEIDFIELGKPIVREWVEETGQNDENIKYQVLKEAAKPLLEVPRNLNTWLEAPEHQRTFEEAREWHRFNHHRLLMGIAFSLSAFLISLVFVFLAVWTGSELMQITAGSAAIFSLTTGILIFRKHKNWITEERKYK